MTRRHAIVGVSLLAIAGTGFWLFRPSQRYDLDLVHPRLRDLREPYRNVRTGYYMDGGTIGIEIVDQEGHQEQFCLPAHLGETNRYTRVFVGAMQDRKAGAMEIPEPEHTKRMLIQVIALMPKRTADDDFCLMQLRRRPSDLAVCLIHKWTGKYDH